MDNDKWGYVVCFGTIITFVASIGHVNSFGLIYNDYIKYTHSTAKSLTTAHGVFAIMLAVGGLILNLMSKKYSLQSGGYIGAITLSTGSLLTVFITNTNQLPVTFGILQGIGFGMMVPVCYSTLNIYFLKKRTQVMSICKATQSIILMWYPQLINIFKSYYGFRGTLLVLAGISLHTIPGMATMKMKKLITNEKSVENGVRRHEEVDLMSNIENEDKYSIEVVKKIRSCRIWHELLDILNLKVYRDSVYCNICLGLSFVNFSDLLFFILLPMLLFQYEYNTNLVATCISICAGADVTGRCALAFISGFININTRLLFYLSTFFTFLGRIALLQVREYVWVVMLASILGVLRAWLHVASPLVISSHVSHQDFPGAYALFMLAAGLVNVVCAPLIGLLKDVYQDYVPAFYVLTLCCAPCLLLWPVEYALKNK